MDKFWGRKEIEISKSKPITERPLEWDDEIIIECDESVMDVEIKGKKEVQ